MINQKMMPSIFLTTVACSCLLMQTSTSFTITTNTVPVPTLGKSFQIFSKVASATRSITTTTTTTSSLFSSTSSTSTSTKEYGYTLDIILFGIGDLRTTDHGGLQNALVMDSSSNDNQRKKVLPLVILDTKDTLSNIPMGRTHTYDNASILHTSLHSLQSNLKSKYNLDLHVVCSSSGDEKKKLGVSECVQDVIQQYTSTVENENETMDKIVIHSCNLGDVDNHLGYGPYGHLMQTHSHLDSIVGGGGVPISVQGWDCHLRNQPWDDLTQEMNDFPSIFIDYEKKYVRGKSVNDSNDNENDDDMLSSTTEKETYEINGVTIPSMTNNIPSIDEICTLLRTALCIEEDDENDIQSTTSNKGLYATHWGGLDTSKTLEEGTILNVIDIFLGDSGTYEDIRGDNALVQKLKWWNSDTNDNENDVVLKRNPQSLEHASMNWIMTGGSTNTDNTSTTISSSSSTKIKTDSLIEAELLTRYLAAPLLFGLISPKYIWNQAEKVCQKHQSPFDFFASYKSSTNAMKSIVENREWHKLFAAKNLRMTMKEKECDATSSSSSEVEYDYLRWHGFLCRYGKKAVNLAKSNNEKEGIVLVHGFGASGGQWEKAMNELEKLIDGNKNDRNVEAFAPDLIGFGQAEKPSLTYTQYLWEGYTADCVKEIGLGKLHWSKFILGGNSIGAYTAMGAAADDSNADVSSSDSVSALGAKGSGKCQGLVLMNSAGRIISQDEIDESERTVAESTAKDMLGLSSPPPRGIAKVGGNGLLAYLRPRIPSICVNLYPTNPEAVDDNLCEGILRDSLDPGAINVMISGSKLPPPRTANELLGANFGSSKSRQALQFTNSVKEASFDGPVLVAQGILDPLNDAKGRANMLETLRQGIVVDRIDAGHCPHDELPSTIASSIADWMEDSVWSENVKHVNQPSS